MPKISKSDAQKERLYAAEYPGEFIVNHGQQLYCKLCNLEMNYDKRQQNRDSVKHTKKRFEKARVTAKAGEIQFHDGTGEVFLGSKNYAA